MRIAVRGVNEGVTRRRALGMGAAFVSATTCLARPGIVLGQDITFFRIGTGTTGGVYFPIGGIIANAISNPPGSRACDNGGSCGVPGLIAVAQSTAGSVANVAAISGGAIESGLCQADIAYWAWKGEGPFQGKGPNETLRAIANLYQEVLQIVVRRESKIVSIADLKGKKISIGPKQSGSAVDGRIVLNAFKIRQKDFTVDHSDPGQAAEMLADGLLDAIIFLGGRPTPVILDLAERIDIRLVPIAGPEAVPLIEDYPFFSVAAVPDGIYKGVTNTVTLGVGAQWICSASVSAEMIYGVTKALWHPANRPLFDRGHPEARAIRIETALQGISIPLHPGAEQYYREAKIIE